MWVFILQLTYGQNHKNPKSQKNFDPLKREPQGKRKTGQRAKGEKIKGLKSSPAIADKTKTSKVEVDVAPKIDVANRRTAISRIGVPRTAPKR